MTLDSPAVRPARLAAQRMHALQNDIMDLILRRDLDVGDAMPTENELCAELGVGRNTIREALKVLQALGVVEIRHGFGTFVAATSFTSLGSSLAFRGRLSLRHGGQEALELVDVRQALESGLVGPAIDAMSEADIVVLDELVTAMETRAQKGVSFLDEDQNFHRHLYTPLRNELLSSLLEVFWNVYRQIHEDAGVEQHGLIESAEQHRDILNAIVRRDKVKAAEKINLHFEGIRSHLMALGR